MDRFQRIQQASEMKKLQYNNNYSNQAGFVDLTLRLGLPNHDYSDINNPTEICQSSLNSNYLFSQASLFHFNGSHMSTTHDQVHISLPLFLINYQLFGMFM